MPQASQILFVSSLLSLEVSHANLAAYAKVVCGIFFLSFFKFVFSKQNLAKYHGEPKILLDKIVLVIPPGLFFGIDKQQPRAANIRGHHTTFSPFNFYLFSFSLVFLEQNKTQGQNSNLAYRAAKWLELALNLYYIELIILMLEIYQMSSVIMYGNLMAAKAWQFFLMFNFKSPVVLEFWKLLFLVAMQS